MSSSSEISEFRLATQPHGPAPNSGLHRKPQSPGFGRVFTDHMARVDWTVDRGWHDPRVEPYGDFSISPANMTLHYGQAVFEGMKAYRQPDGTPALFRPLENARRFNRSARRMAMPPMPEALFLAAVETIVRIDAEWVPSGPDRSLYLRPFAFATEAQLGVRPALAYAFIVIASPVEPFFSADRSGVSVWVSEEYVRAVPGGTGEAKCAGNYAAGLLAQEHASENGCDQVLWLDSLTRTNIEEMGGMNVFFVENIDGESRLVTPALTGTLLAGVVRDSLIQLAQATGLAVEERTVRIDELRAGRFDEAFACGTAAVIAPIVEVRGAGFASRIGDGSAGDLTRRLRNKLLEIQYGVAEDPGGWVHRVEII